LNIKGNFEIIRIYDVYGKLILNTIEKSIDTKNIEAGIYLVNITKNNMVITKKITITK